MEGKVIGTCCIDIATTRAKQKTSDNKYLDHVLIRCTLKGKNPQDGLAGYAEYVTVQATTPKGTSLVGYSPEQEATSTSYDVGVNASSDKTLGITASTTFTKKALEIDNYSDISQRLFKVGFDYQHANLRPNWKLNKYSYNESLQRMHYVIKTGESNYKTSLIVDAKFQKWSKTPGYWATQYDSYKSSSVVIWITAGK